MTGKFRGVAHWDCNTNFQLTKNVTVNNLRSYDSHLIFSELDKFDVQISLILNGLEKYMVLFLNKNLVFIEIMQFMNPSLDKLVKNPSHEGFKYLVDEVGWKNSDFLKQKGDYPYEYMNSFERFNEEKLPARKYFFSSIKKEKIGDDGKISHGHISVKDYLTCEKNWDKFEMGNISILCNKLIYYFY